MNQMFLPDINLWLALAFESHVHHIGAKDWFDIAPNRSCHFCRMTQQGFLRLATNPRAFGAEAVSLNRAWQLYDALRDDPRVDYAEESSSIEPLWQGHTQGQSFSPKIWNDAFLAAFAESALRVVSEPDGNGGRLDRAVGAPGRDARRALRPRGGKLARYRLHLGTAAVHIEPGHHLCIVPDRSLASRQPIYLPFAEGSDPKVAELLSKMFLLISDDQITDAPILGQIKAAQGEGRQIG